MQLVELITSETGTIVDVRSPGEFSGGHVDGSINIPLQEVPARLNELHALPKPLILCCASGARSSQAYLFLADNKIECHNAGSWFEIEYIRNKTL